MMSVFRTRVKAQFHQDAAKKRRSGQPVAARQREITSHDLGSDDNRFLEVRRILESIVHSRNRLEIETLLDPWADRT